MSAPGWSLTAEQRKESITRAAENLFALAYSRGKPVSDREAADAAVVIEEKAYTGARIESTTTTGVRPAEESLKAYVRQGITCLMSVDQC